MFRLKCPVLLSRKTLPRSIDISNRLPNYAVIGDT